MIDKTVIESIQDEWLKLTNTFAGEATRTFLNRVLKLMYIEPSSFILEFLQNAEDARRELDKGGGYFKITLEKDKVVIEHNGKPFDEKDLKNLCAITSSKKPSQGYKGFIGIGWKSVFKVSSRVDVYSGNLAFSFSKDSWTREVRNILEKYGLEPGRVLWQVTPIPIQSSEYIPPDVTKFVIILHNSSYYESISKFLEELDPSLFLFLEYISEVRIFDKPKGRNVIMNWYTQGKEGDENLSIQYVDVSMLENDRPKFMQRFIIFKKKFQVPDYVKRDSTTEDAMRSDVNSREVSIAFALDISTENLQPIEKFKFWGLYSFLPLYEVRTGLQFLIQGDFIVHPGRRYLNTECTWNKWMMECVTEVVRDAIKHLMKKYKTSYLTVFDYRRIGDEVYNKLIEPTIIKVIKEELQDPLVICYKGHEIKLSSAVKLPNDAWGLIEQGILNEEELKYIYETEVHILDPKVKLREGKDKAKVLNLEDLLDEHIIRAKMQENKAIEFLAEIYKLMYKNNLYPYNKRPLITVSGDIKHANEVYIPEISEEVKELVEKFPEVRNYLNRIGFVHEKLAEALGENILSWLGVRKIGMKEIAKILLDEILTEKPAPDIDKIVKVTAVVKKSGIRPEKPIWVVARDGTPAKSNDIYYPLKIIRDREEYISLLEKLEVKFLDIDKYLVIDSNEESWRDFFQSTSIHHLSIYKDFDLIMSRVKDALEKAGKDENIELVRMLKYLYENLNLYSLKGNLKILTYEGGLTDSSKCLLHDIYNPQERWTRWRDRGFVKVGPFISPMYIECISDYADISSWKKFLKDVLGVADSVPSGVIEDFAIWYAELKLRERGFSIEGGKGEGYDIVVKRDNMTIYVEIKGRRNLYESEITLTRRESEMAVEHGERYWLIVVTDIPDKPRMYCIKNPARLPHDIALSGELIEKEGEIMAQDDQ